MREANLKCRLSDFVRLLDVRVLCALAQSLLVSGINWEPGSGSSNLKKF